MQTIRDELQAAIDAAPVGTSGLVIDPWTPGEVYGVAARWGEASAQVYTYGDRGWEPTSHQVADYQHSPQAALIAELAISLRAGGDDPAEADTIAEDAVVF